MIGLDDLVLLHGARTSGAVFARSFEGIAYDSRTLRPGDLFVAVRTERADGHEFMEEACRHGAAGVLCERPRDLSQCSATCIVVPDTRAALIEWARVVLRRRPLDAIAIGGSVGKTSTQMALLRAVSAGEGDDTSVFHNGNFNDLFGLPIALGGLAPSHRTALFELASSSAGELAELAAIVRPQIAVVTNVAPVHLETLGSLDRIVAEQRELLQALPADGWAVLNGDDERVRALADATPARVLRYGYGPDGDLAAFDVEAGPEGLNVCLAYRGDHRRLQTRLLGFHNVYTLLAATGAALAFGLSLPEIVERLEGFAPLAGRLRPLAGEGGATLLDDTQSASPRSLAAALEALALFPLRKLAVLGEVSDLHVEHEAGDEAVAAQLAATVDLLVTCSERAEALAEAATAWGLPADRTIATDSVQDATAALRPRLRPGDAVLVKGSEAARMERVVGRLLADPRDADRLVRQDAGWKQRVFVAFERPTWIEVDLDAIANNVERACALAAPAEVMVVLKADAYGHGAVRVARTAFLHGAGMGGVACLSEAIVLREAGIRAPLLLLGYTPDWQAREVVRHGLAATVFSLDFAGHLSRAAQTAGAPPVPVHVKVDTGMTRLGLSPEEIPAFLTELDGMPGIRIEGIFTHFATADQGADDPLTQIQLTRFRDLIAQLRRSGRRFRYVHAANSAGLINGLGTEFNLVRVGVLTYGLDPAAQTPAPAEFRPALAFKTRVAQVKVVPAGTCVSYGCAFVAKRPSVIAVIPVGYGDGFRRSPHNWGEVLVRGRRAPLAGNVCMDMAMLDVTDIPGAKEGDEVVLIGRQGDEAITANDVARRLGTISYEVVTEILPRVPRMVP